jgi:hypothetical protein
MKNLLFLTFLSLVILTVACTPPEGEPVKYANACDSENDNKIIETVGFLDTGLGLYCSSTSGRMECGFKLKNNLKDEKSFSADIPIASGANSMDKVKSGYDKSDIVVRGNDGKRIDLTKKVTVTGKLNSSKDVVSKNLVCYMKVYKIEQ